MPVSAGGRVRGRDGGDFGDGARGAAVRRTRLLHPGGDRGYCRVPAAAGRAARSAAGSAAADVDDRDEEGRGQPAAADVNAVETQAFRPWLSTDLGRCGRLLVEKYGVSGGQLPRIGVHN